MDLPIEWHHVGGHAGSDRTYLCAQGKHDRCPGLISPGGRVAYLGGCDAVPSCGCNDRARAS